MTPTAMITGASEGIGWELARLFAKDGYDVVLVARSGARLEELAQEMEERYGISATVLPKDLSLPGAVPELAAALDERRIAVDALVNAAGFNQYGPFAEADAGTMNALVQVNVAALTELTRALLPAMIARGSGLVVNMSSNAAFQPGPLMSAYYASKVFVLNLSVALAEEVRGTGVTVTALCPGPYASTFQARARMQDSKLVKGRRLPEAAEVAEWGYATARAGRPFAVRGARWKLFAFAMRLLPRTTAARMAGSAQARV